MTSPRPLNKTRLLPLYVVGIGAPANQRQIVRPDGFQGYQVLYCLYGNGILEIEDQQYTISAGDAFFFRPDIPHSYYAKDSSWGVRWIVFAGDGAENLMDYFSFGKSEVFHIHNLESFDAQVDTISDMFWSESDPDKEVKVSALLYKLLIQVAEYKNQPPRAERISRNERYQRLLPVIEMLKTRYPEDLSLQDMAAAIGVTTNHLCRLFQSVFGTTPLKYLTTLRLNMAKRYLCSPDNWKVKEVATTVGFKDPSYFCAVFKKAEGITPEDFRRNNAF